MQFVRHLGHGGNGVAAAFRFPDPGPNGERRYLVAKSNHTVNGDISINWERGHTSRFRNAMHIVQLEQPAPLVNRRRSERIRARTPGQPDGSWPNHIADVNNILFLEYLPRGSLHKALCTMQSRQMVVPNRALWHMFHCRKFMSSTNY
ncbi:hypothetical protein L209DRAFT_684148 [Thermothelomyces heterothallicus CBS 203.75]